MPLQVSDLHAFRLSEFHSWKWHLRSICPVNRGGPNHLGAGQGGQSWSREVVCLKLMTNVFLRLPVIYNSTKKWKYLDSSSWYLVFIIVIINTMTNYQSWQIMQWLISWHKCFPKTVSNVLCLMRLALQSLIIKMRKHLLLFQINPCAHGGFQRAPLQTTNPGADDQTAPDKSGCEWFL